MSLADQDKANAVSEQMMPLLSNLWGRWQDEKEYEDWRDYENAIRIAVPLHPHPIIKISKRPFGVTFALGKYHIQLYINANTCGWKRVK